MTCGILTATQIIHHFGKFNQAFPFVYDSGR